MNDTDELNTELFDSVREYCENAVLVATDGCHKIYLAMDDIEADWFRENYEHIVEGTPEEMLVTVIGWYENSCFLRFVNAVYHNEDDPNAGFITLISQFADEEDEDEPENDEDEE
jgi:hypothetical protein